MPGGRSLGREHPNVATAVNNLAELYREQGDYAHAQAIRAKHAQENPAQ